MKHIGNAAAVAILFSLPAFGQAPAPKPPAAAPAPATAPAPAMKAEKEPMQVAEAKPARKSRATEDARSCLQMATNTEIIKCAEPYR
jgi:hypothetical protein